MFDTADSLLPFDGDSGRDWAASSSPSSLAAGDNALQHTHTIILGGAALLATCGFVLALTIFVYLLFTRRCSDVMCDRNSAMIIYHHNVLVWFDFNFTDLSIV